MFCGHKKATKAAAERQNPMTIIDKSGSTAGADGPDLTGRQGIAINGVIAVQLGGGDKFFDPIEAEGLAEVGIAELALDDALLLLFHAAA